MPLKAHEFDLVVNKFGLETRRGDHFYAWLTVNGRRIVSTKRSWKSGRDLPAEFQLRRQFKLNAAQMRSAIDCTMSREDYLEHLRGLGLIP